MNQRVVMPQISPPASTEVLLQRGIEAFESGQLDLAESLFRDVTTLDPASSDGHFCLGNTLRDQGKTQEAIGAFLQSLNLDAANANAHYGLAGMLKQLGRLDAAQGHYRQVVALEPEHVEAHNNLGNVLKSMGRLGEAVGCYQRALDLRPDYYQAWYNLGIAHQLLGEIDAAVDAYRAALDIQPGLVVAHVNLATAYRTQGEVEASIAHYQRAIELEPRQLQAQANLAALYERTNRLSEARASIEAGLAIAPADPSCLFVKAVVLRRSSESQAALDILHALPEDGLPEEYLVRRHFETGKLLDQLGDYAAAFQAFSLGNQRHRYSAAAGRTDKNRFLARLDRARVLLEQRGPSWPAGAPSNAEAPVFLVGFPRSGTTLLDQVLDAHPALAVLEEAPLIPRLAREIERSLGAYPEPVPDLDEATLQTLRNRYYREAARHHSPAPGVRMVDKLPLNIEHLSLIQRLFPTARILVASRHPGDTILSNFMQFYQLNDAMANFFSLEDAAQTFRRVNQVWRLCDRHLPLATHEVRYESLVGNMELEVRAIVDFLGLPLAEQMFEFHRHARERKVISTPSYEQVLQPLYATSVGRWQNYRAMLAPIMEELECLRTDG